MRLIGTDGLFDISISEEGIIIGIQPSGVLTEINDSRVVNELNGVSKYLLAISKLAI